MAGYHTSTLSGRSYKGSAPFFELRISICPLLTSERVLTPTLYCPRNASSGAYGKASPLIKVVAFATGALLVAQACNKKILMISKVFEARNFIIYELRS